MHPHAAIPVAMQTGIHGPLHMHGKAIRMDEPASFQNKKLAAFDKHSGSRLAVAAGMTVSWDARVERKRSKAQDEGFRGYIPAPCQRKAEATSRSNSASAIARQAIRVAKCREGDGKADALAESKQGEDPDALAEYKQSDLAKVRMGTRQRKRNSKEMTHDPSSTIRFTFDFAVKKSQATADGNPQDCPHGECRKRKICTGGPRGTARKHGAPLCCTNRGLQAMSHRKTQREKLARERKLEAQLEMDYRRSAREVWE